MIENKIFGIALLQKGGLVNQPNSGTWGNRGQGNELQSALENGLSGLWNGAKWTFDKVVNAPNYIEDGINYVFGLIPGGPTPKQSVEDGRLARNTPFGQSYTDSRGNVHINLLNTGTPPLLPGLPKNPSKDLLKIWNDMKQLRPVWSVRESLLRKAGKLSEMENTKTAKRYRDLEKLFEKTLKQDSKKPVDNIKLTRRQTASYKAEKARVTDDLRATNSGRSAIRERQWDEVERMMRKDQNPKIQSMLRKHDIKIAKGKDSSAIRTDRINMLKTYLKEHAKGFFPWLED